jgi:DNA-binding response OmpR family regulator
LKRILIIDDDPSTRESLEMYFTESGYIVDSANDGMMGLDLIKNKNPDIVISDNLMPKLSGIELASTLKDISRKIPFILISSFKNSKELIEGLEIFAFLEKPIDIKELEYNIIRALAH